MSSKYLFQYEQDREREAVERLLLDRAGARLFRSQLEPSLGWRGEWSWYAVRIPKARLLPMDVDPARFPGDVDLCAGPLELMPNAYAHWFADARERLPHANPSWWDYMASLQSLAEGAVVWPPLPGLLTAAEVKAAFLDEAGIVQGVRLGDRRPGRRRVREKRVWKQAANLALMGFDRVALLWLATTAPLSTESGGFDLWRLAADRAQSIPTGIPSVSHDGETRAPFGEIILLVGSVPGGLETMRGTSGCVVRRAPVHLTAEPQSEASRVRTAIKEWVQRTCQASTVPRSIPVIIRACADDHCAATFVAHPPQNTTCQHCCGPTR